MAKVNSTRKTRSASSTADSTGNTSWPKGATTPNLIQSACDYCVGMNAFFELVEREISEKNNTDFDNIEFLVKGAKAELSRFGKLAYDAEAEMEGGAA